MLPRMHGYQVSRSLRADGDLGRVKILVASAKSYAADIESATAAGADAYLTKPYSAKALVEKVAELLSAPRVDASLPAEPEAPTQTRRSQDLAPMSEAQAPAASDIRVCFWGTRGSCPAPGSDTVRYGGNTACTELRFGDTLIIVDCGSGIRMLGQSLMREFKGKPIEGHIFVGHTHWDHIQGFPFFVPLYIARNRFNVYSVSGAGKSLERVFRGQMAADYFPVPLKSLACELQFVELEGPVKIGPVTAKYHFLNHPGVAIGFRFEAHGKAITYLSDHETFVRLNGVSEVTRKQDADVVEFCRGSDILICEAQYTEEEYQLKRGWGHSTFYDAVERGIASGSRHLVIFHHEPVHTDDQMDGFLEEARRKIREAGSSLECSMALEGMVLKL